MYQQLSGVSQLARTIEVTEPAPYFAHNKSAGLPTTYGLTSRILISCDPS
jgi:hypothetical protein